MKESLLTTGQLLEAVVNTSKNPESNSDCVEASLFLKGGARARHFISYAADTKILYDEGIDGVRRETTLEEFANTSPYNKPGARWRIWNQ